MAQDEFQSAAVPAYRLPQAKTLQLLRDTKTRVGAMDGWMTFSPSSTSGKDAAEPSVVAPGAADRITVLLATYNGERFLEAQLNSLADQTVGLIDVLASDDGSTDGTLAMLQAWQARWSKGKFSIVRGPSAGFAANFRSLATQPSIDGDYIAFCDQDDIWLPDKLEAALAALKGTGCDGAALYCSRTCLVDEEGRELGLSPLFRRPPGFANAIVQSIGGGNTMLMNRPAFEAFAESARRTDFVSHDWWAYILVSGMGGEVVYDPVPHILYRQHSDNLVGDNMGWRARLRRLAMLREGRFARWTDANLAGIELCREFLAPRAIATLDAFEAARASHNPLRLTSAGIFRQTTFGNIGLYVATVMGWI